MSGFILVFSFFFLMLVFLSVLGTFADTYVICTKTYAKISEEFREGLGSFPEAVKNTSEGGHHPMRVDIFA